LKPYNIIYILLLDILNINIYIKCFLYFFVGITHNIYVYLAISIKTTTLFRLFSFPFHARKYIFWLRFGLANAMNNYLKIKVRVVCVGNFLMIYFCILEIFETNTSSRFLCKKSPFEFVFVLKFSGIQRLFCSQKACVKCSY
jgi:hypothetical protein